MTNQERIDRIDRYAAKQRRAAARRPHRETDHAGKRREKMAAPMKTVCSECDRIMVDGPGEVSHGICDPCARAWWLRNIPDSPLPDHLLADEAGVAKGRAVWKDLVMVACVVAAGLAVWLSRACG